MSYIHAIGVEDPTAILTGIPFESLQKRATLFRLLLKLQTLFYELIQSEQDRKTCIGLLSDSVDPDAHPALYKHLQEFTINMDWWGVLRSFTLPNKFVMLVCTILGEPPLTG